MGSSLGLGGRIRKMSAYVAHHERAALLVVAVVEEAVDASSAAGARPRSQADVRAQSELLPLPGHLVVAAAGSAPLGRVRDPVEAEPARHRADQIGRAHV